MGWAWETVSQETSWTLRWQPQNYRLDLWVVARMRPSHMRSADKLLSSVRFIVNICILSRKTRDVKIITKLYNNRRKRSNKSSDEPSKHKYSNCISCKFLGTYQYFCLKSHNKKNKRVIIKVKWAMTFWVVNLCM